MEFAEATAAVSALGSAAMAMTAAEGEEQVRVSRKTLQAVLEQCQRALEVLKNDGSDGDLGVQGKSRDGGGQEEEEEEGSGPDADDCETDELHDLLKSKFESPDFLDKLGSIHMSISRNSFDDGASWDIVNTTDLWEEKHFNGENVLDQDDYVFVRQEDVVEGIARFMAAYLLSLEHTKELTPNLLQQALSKTFSKKKKKSKLQKALDGSKVIYNVASWSATAIGIYQNPMLIRAAAVAFWSSYRVISNLL